MDLAKIVSTKKNYSFNEGEWVLGKGFINKNKSLLKELRKNNIKIFAYHINYDEGIDEDYVTKYEMDAIFGIYADEWTFE